MRRLLSWVAVTIGIAALVRWLRRRRERSTALPAQVSAEPAQDPAAELRRKLAESRAGEEPEEGSETATESVEERRADVHEQGRSALSEMTPPDED